MSKQRKITVRDKPSTKKKLVKRKKLLTTAQAKVKKAKREGEFRKISEKYKNRRLGSSGSLGLIGGAIGGGIKAVAKYVTKKIAKKAAVKLVDKKLATAKKKSKKKRSKNSKA